MLTRSALTRFGTTSCRSQLSNSTNWPGTAGNVPHGRVSRDRRRLARRRRHEAIQPRILEFDSGRSRRDVHVVGAAHRRERMQMQAVHHVSWD